MFRRSIALALSAAGLLVPAIALSADAQRLEIDMSSYKYMPETITLQHGQPYVLHFVNRAKTAHNFVAKRFFEAAKLASGDRQLAGKGEVELRGGQAVDIHLTAPAPGRYDVHCSHFMHSTFGMKAMIVVT